MSKICENCKTDYDLIYGSGRFCSLKCARGFSTKEKRKEINEKVSKKLIKYELLDKKCEFCDTIFQHLSNRKSVRFCSRSCSAKSHNARQEIREILSISRINYIKSGKINGNSIKSIYLFNGNEIKCDSNIERACINYFEILGAKSIKRCDRVIFYTHLGIKRRFLPDFEIILNDKIYIVEAKSYISIKSLNKKWKNYNEKSFIKQKELESYCNENNLISFWFTKDLNLSYYNKLSKY